MANAGAFKKGEKRPNQGKRGPNKSTALAREAIAKFVDGNASKMQGWLDKVAKTDPERAFNMVTALMEYHIPKLARTELTGEGGGPVVVAMDSADQRA